MEIQVSGTHLWYYTICKRQVWLISRHIIPDQENDNLLLGRYIDRESYRRLRKSLIVDNNKIDIFFHEEERLVVAEVKKSSKAAESAKMQLSYYLLKLKEKGIEVEGELRFPTEKGKVRVKLDEALEEELRRMTKEIQAIIECEKAPLPLRIPYCKKCAYYEYCWS